MENLKAPLPDGPDTGKKGLEMNYKNGELEGIFTSWYYNAQKERETNYREGVNNGLSTEWHLNGKLNQK